MDSFPEVLVTEKPADEKRPCVLVVCCKLDSGKLLFATELSRFPEKSQYENLETSLCISVGGVDLSFPNHKGWSREKDGGLMIYREIQATPEMVEKTFRNALWTQVEQIN